MTILEVVQRASMRLGFERPDVVFSSTDRTMLEVQDAVNEAALKILNDFDWQALTKTATITGDAVTTAFPLPDDYYRMTKTAELWTNAGPGWDIQGVTPEEYLSLDSLTFATWKAYWAIFGNALNIQPVRPTSETIRYMYINKNCVTPSAGSAKPEFTADDDSFVLDERLLRLCFIATRKQNKGFDYAADLNEYEMALSNLSAADKGTRFVRSRSSRLASNTRPAWPFGELG